MILTHAHFTGNLSPAIKINFMKTLERLDLSLETILSVELSHGNKILQVNTDTEEKGDLTILLQHTFCQEHKNDQLDKLIFTDAHDHGVYYVTKKQPKKALIAANY
jgi:hypothetical protein